MAVSTAKRIDAGNQSDFVTEADWIPSFWNFLLRLDRNDLIAELVQNDLDQGATRTTISFDAHRLVCEGNGRAVDADGWERLRKIQGAGYHVPTKRRMIGVKNHGLKTAFTIGDEIRLFSAGRTVTQTLYANGPNAAPHPGASPRPEPDKSAPAHGCRIEISYRTTDVEPAVGEAIRLGAIDDSDVDNLFESACAATPEQFAGIVSPDFAPRYEIVLRHWRLGEARFAFSCTHPRRVKKDVEVFRRRCTVDGTASALSNDLQEQAARRLLPLTGRLKQRVAGFFRRGNRFFVEVSWLVNGRGQPRAGTGRFRYPIGYPATSQEARTGHGAFLNAPIVSDTERHGPATNDPTNAELRVACETLLVDVLLHHVIPRWGAHGLNPLVPSTESDDATVRPLLATLASKGGVPTLDWKTSVKLSLKGRNKTASGRRRYRFVVPVTSWMESSVDSSLAIVCPRSERQIDSRVHRDIIRLFADGKTDGFCQDFITFTENDAFSALTGEENEYFNNTDDSRQQLAAPLIARACLDLITAALAHDNCDGTTEDALRGALVLPDTRRDLTPLRDLYTSASVPSDIPGVRMPHIIHSDLTGHPLLRRPKWRRPKYTLAEFLASGTLQQANNKTRERFWDWLRHHADRIGARERPKLADLAIWPDISGRLCALPGLCFPRSEAVSEILAGAIRRPHQHVRRCRLVSLRGNRRTSLRRTPSEEEVGLWLQDRLATFSVGDAASPSSIAALRQFEADVAVLLKNSNVARVLRQMDIVLPALASDGSIQRRDHLVAPSGTVTRLALRDRFVLQGMRHAGALNTLRPALREPTAAILLATFAEDPGNRGALQARLQQFLASTEPGSPERARLANMPILPACDRLCQPCELTFGRLGGDYWGDWKIVISARDLSQDDQRRYRSVGVMSSLPNRNTSHAFFQWLSETTASVLQRHMPCVLRHILHREGPEQWAESYTDTPFIPAEGRDGVQLVSLRMAQSNRVFLRDARPLADMVTRRDPGVLVVIDRVQEVQKPISESLRRLGVRSLWEALGEPRTVRGVGATELAPPTVGHAVHRVRVGSFRRTFLKGLAELGVGLDTVRHDWHDRLSRIQSVRLAGRVDARYCFRRRWYTVPVGAGFDSESGIFWVKRSPDALSGLYEAIAGQLVFKSTVRPVELMALERVLRMTVDDPSYGRPMPLLRASEERDVAEEQPGTHASGVEDGEDVDPGEAVFGHSPFKPDPARNLPKPSPISRDPGARRSRFKRQRTNRGDVAPSSAPPLEKVHIEELKSRHYASHCQMCLCAKAPAQLAPTGSYVEWEEIRRWVIEAHHVDLKSAGGGRHAGNLILLCKFHHDNYGRRLTRDGVLTALQGRIAPRAVRFGVDREVMGEVVEVRITGKDGDKMELFFTDEHAAYWRDLRR